MDAFETIIFIILILILLYIFYRHNQNIRKCKRRKKRIKKLTKYEESGHNFSKNTIKNYVELDETPIETPEEDIMKQISLSMIARYNLHNPAILTKHEDNLINIINTFPEETAPHLNFLIDRIIPHRVEEIRQMPVLIPDEPIFHFDPQNVHSSFVNDSIRNVLGKLKTEDSSSVEDLDAFITLKLDELSSEDKNKLNAVMNRINTNFTDKFDDMTEYEVLQKVHFRCDNEEKKNLLISNLLDAHENGNVVCATGRLNRFVGTLNALDNEMKPIVTEEIVRNEAFNKAGRIRDQMLEKKDEQFIKKYNSNIEDKEVLDFTQSVHDEIRKQLNENYAHLSNVKLQKIIDEAILF